MTGLEALREAMRLEQARIYGTTVREQVDTGLRDRLTPDTADNIEQRRAVLASLDDHEPARVVHLRTKRQAS